LLQAGGFEPALFSSAETFIAARANRAWLCLIVDVHLTGMSSIDLQQRLRGEGWTRIGFCPDAASRRQAKLTKGAKLVELAGGPHSVLWTQADQINSVLVKFLA
jgi:hypothetical protein